MGFRNTQVKNDTELKSWWCEHGEKLERDFIAVMNKHYPSFNISINPKKFVDPTAPDLIMDALNKESLGDLKSQRTPFFSAGKYGLDPQYTFTFNVKDYHRYLELYSNLNIIIWVDWQQTNMKLGNKNIEVKPMEAFYQITLSDLVRLIQDNNSPIHNYKRRPVAKGGNHPLKGMVDKDGNATSSYLIDLRLLKPFLVIK